MTELYLFHFPAMWEYQIAAAATLRSFELMLIGREDDYQFYVTGLNEGATFLFDTFSKKVVCYKPDREPFGLFDVEFHFDVERAKALSVNTKYHVTFAFGVMLGVYGSAQLPELMGQPVDHNGKTKILLSMDHDWNGWADLEDIILTNVNDVELVKLDRCAPADYTLQNVFDLAVNNQFIVGVRSPLTYLAAALGRRVLEFYPTRDMETSWLTKAPGSRTYTMLVEGEQPHRATLVWRLLKESLWLTAR